MKKENAIKFLARLHELETLYRVNVLTQIEKELIEALRTDFLKAYRSELWKSIELYLTEI